MIIAFHPSYKQQLNNYTICSDRQKTLEKVFYQRIFPKWQLPKGIFPRVFSQIATSQMCNFPKRLLPKPVLAAAIGPQPVLAGPPSSS